MRVADKVCPIRHLMKSAFGSTMAAWCTCQIAVICLVVFSEHVELVAFQNEGHK
jgi:hypothetical protein